MTLEVKVDLANKKIPVDDFLAMRPSVLAAWPTGKESEPLDDSCAYHNEIPQAKSFAHAMRKADDSRATLTQPRAGVCLPQELVKLLLKLQKEGEADLLPTTIDSYTRQNRYAEAATGIEESMKGGRSLLNGFPAVNYGVSICREVTEALGKPVQVRHGTPDARLLAEITLAGGFTAFEGGGISYNIPYTKNVALERSIADWQYVDRLVGFYAERGVIINREPFGPLTGTLVPPCISNAVAVIEGLLAAEQGVMDVTVGYGQVGNVYQDVAAMTSLRRLAREYFERCGHGAVRITTVFHQWMGGFPADESAAFAVISWGAASAALGGATKIITKTPHEAFGIPTAEVNIAGLRTTRQILNMLHPQQILCCGDVDAEADLIDRETRAILEATLRLGEGDLALGAVRAFQAGVIDIPFAPSRSALGAIVPVRDLNGAVRFFEFGHLPFDDEIKAFHRARLDERARAERRAVSFQMVTDDIYAVSKGRLVGVPR